MKILFTFLVLTIVSALLIQSSAPMTQEEIPVLNTICDDAHIRYICVECDSTEFQDFVQQEPAQEIFE